MLKIYIYKYIFGASLILGTFIVVNADNWFLSWMGLELNLVSFIPLMMDNNNTLSVEGGLKYFILQASASLGLIMGLVSSNLLSIFFSNQLEIYFLSISLMIKMGMAPFHFWFPALMESLNWFSIGVILTWQKLGPLVLLSGLSLTQKWEWGFIILIGLFVGGIGGLNQTSLSKLMAYSSITHMSWMGSSFYLEQWMCLMYLIIYFILTLNVVFIFKSKNWFTINHIWEAIQLNKVSFLSVLMMSSLFFSMGGLPPFLGFFPKWIILNGLINEGFMFMSIFMVMFTLISMYFYLRLSFVGILLVSEGNYKVNINLYESKNWNYWCYLFLMINISGLIVGLSFW